MSFLDGIKPKKSDSDRFLNFDPGHDYFREPIKKSKLKKHRANAPEKLKEDAWFEEKDEKEPSEFAQKVDKKIRQLENNFDNKISYKTVFVFAVFAFLVLFTSARALVAKKNIEKLSGQAKYHLNESFDLINEGKTPEALKEADEAKKNIRDLTYLVQSWGQDIKYLRLVSADNSKLVASERLLSASNLVIETLSSINQELSNISFKSPDSPGASSFSINLSDSARTVLAASGSGKAKLLKGKEELLIAKKGLPSDSGKDIDNAVLAIDKALQTIETWEAILGTDINWLSGTDGKEKNILILFQNNAELRGGSGGSLGSFGIAHFKDGNLLGIDFGTNIYKIDQAYRATVKETTPDQLNWIVPKDGYSMKDSGWDVDGPTAMKNVMSFYQKETGKSVDGAMMIDTTAFISLLNLTGPISVSGPQKEIDAENFRQTVEYEVHKGYFEDPVQQAENEPKKILAEMMPQFLNKFFSSLSDKEKFPVTMSVLSKSLKEKDITFYFNNEDFEARMLKLNLSGAVAPGFADYLYINNSNVDGAKSSLSMKESIKLAASIGDDGQVSDSLLISRKHNGSNVWPDGMNKNFIRILLSQKSSVTKFNPIQGYFEQLFDRGLKDGHPYWMTEEDGKNVVNFWMTTKPGEESKAQIDYVLNYHLDTSGDFSYIIALQRQPGALADSVEFELSYPSGFEPLNVKNYDKNNNKIVLKFDLASDKTIKIKFKKL